MKLGKSTIFFDKGETVFTEISQKYALDYITELSHASGFEVIGNFFDIRKYFADSVWKSVL